MQLNRLEPWIKHVGLVTAILYACGYLASGLYLSNLGIPAIQIQIQNVLTGFLFVLFLAAPPFVFFLPFIMVRPALPHSKIVVRIVFLVVLIFIFFGIATELLDHMLDYNSFAIEANHRNYISPWIIYVPTGPLLIPEENEAKYLLWEWFLGLLVFQGCLGFLLFRPNTRASVKKIAWILMIGGGLMAIHYYADKVHPRWEASFGGGYYGFCSLKVKKTGDGTETYTNKFVVYDDDKAIYLCLNVCPSNQVFVTAADLPRAIKYLFQIHKKKMTEGIANNDDPTGKVSCVRIQKENVLETAYLDLPDGKRVLPWSEEQPYSLVR